MEPLPLLFQNNSLVDFHQGVGASPYLVSTTHNSPQDLLGANQFDSSKYCPNARLVLGVCDSHGQRRFVLVPCKRRDCDVCGPNGRWEIAKRIAYGIRQHWPCAWITLSFETELAEEPVWKPKAVRRLGKFVTWLRKSNPGLQYAATYELQKRGRLHINLLIGPWKSVPKAELQNRWGANLWVEWVQDDKTMGREAAKSYSPESLGKYLSKLEQAVPADWGRRVSYSKGWPKLPEGGWRQGGISWRHEWELSSYEIALFEHERSLGWWHEISIGEWSPLLESHGCHCFDMVLPQDSPRAPP